VQAVDLSEWEKIITKIAKGLFDNKISKDELNADYIKKTYEELEGAIDDGFGTDFTDDDLTTIATNLKANANLFSQAKNVAMQYEIADLMIDENGKPRSFNSFKKDVLALNATYNQTYLQAEYQTVQASSQSAKKWHGIQRRKERYPNLIYKTVGDDNVRDAHKDLANIIKPVDDVFWDSFYPPNGWRCRCFVSQTNKATTDERNPEVDEKNVPELFRQNLAKDDIVIPAKHPYYTLFKASKNGKK